MMSTQQVCILACCHLSVGICLWMTLSARLPQVLAVKLHLSRRLFSMHLPRDLTAEVCRRTPAVCMNSCGHTQGQAAHDYGAVSLLLLRCVMLCLVCGCLKQCKAALRLTTLPACLPHTHQLRLVPLAVLAARSAAPALAIGDCAPALGGRTSLCPGADLFSGQSIPIALSSSGASHISSL